MAAAAAAAGGGVRGADAWLDVLRTALAAEPLPASLEEAVAPLSAVGVDVAAVRAAAARRLNAPPGDWAADDWRRAQPTFPRKLALALHVYTLQDPRVYGALGTAMHAADRHAGPGGVSPALRACLPYAKLLQTAMEEAALLWGHFAGMTTRGVKYAFPQPTRALHDPEAHFPRGRELHWYEFNSSSTDFSVMYRPWFCGDAGPRTLFQVRCQCARAHA